MKMYTNVTEEEFKHYNPGEYRIWVWESTSELLSYDVDCYEVEVNVVDNDDLYDISFTDEETDNSYLIPLDLVKWV